MKCKHLLFFSFVLLIFIGYIYVDLNKHKILVKTNNFKNNSNLIQINDYIVNSSINDYLIKNRFYADINQIWGRLCDDGSTECVWFNNDSFQGKDCLYLNYNQSGFMDCILSKKMGFIYW